MIAAARPATGWRRRAGPASAPRFRAGQADGSTSRSSAGARRRRVQGTRASALPDLRPAPPGWPHSTGAPAARKGRPGSVSDQGADRCSRPIGNRDAVVVRVRDIETGGTGTDAAGLTECGGGAGPIGVARGPAAQPGRHRAAPRLDAPDLVVVAVRQGQDAVPSRDTQRVLEAGRVPFPLLVAADE